MASAQTAQGVRLTETNTAKIFALGTVVIDDFGARWIYVQASAAIAIYAYTKISAAYAAAEGTTVLLPATEPAMLGCAQIAFANAEFGFVFRGPGAHTGKFSSSCAQDVKIYTTATAGAVDDAVTTLIPGLKLITTIGAGASVPAWAAVELVTVLA